MSETQNQTNGSGIKERAKTMTEIAAPTRDPKKENAALKKLFDEYETLEGQYATKQKELAALAAKRSSIVKKVAEFGKGPYNRGGRQLTVLRKNETYFFKGPGEATGIEV